MTAIQHPMQQFHDMIAHVIQHGKRQANRTGVDTLFVPGYHLRFDLERDDFPAITTKKLAFKSAVGELVGFFRGYDSAAQFRAIGCKVWDGNANATKSWLENPNRIGREDYLGRIYSKQWTDWRDWREARTPEEKQLYSERGYEVIAEDTVRGVTVYRRGINQLEQALEAIMTNPTSRRILITGWRPDEMDAACIAACHVDWNFIVDTESNTLHLCMYQRSFDTFLAFNVAMGGIFLSIMAKLAGLRPATFNHFIGDCHVYLSHLEQAKLMLSRDHRPQPKLVLGDSIPTLTSVDDIKGVFTRIQPEDISLEGYDPHPAIPAPMAA
jgi:thymidylate synthase